MIAASSVLRATTEIGQVDPHVRPEVECRRRDREPQQARRVLEEAGEVDGVEDRLAHRGVVGRPVARAPAARGRTSGGGRG